LRFDPLSNMSAQAHRLRDFGTPPSSTNLSTLALPQRRKAYWPRKLNLPPIGRRCPWQTEQHVSMIWAQGNDQDLGQRVRFVSPLAARSRDNRHGIAAFERLLAFL